MVTRTERPACSGRPAPTLEERGDAQGGCAWQHTLGPPRAIFLLPPGAHRRRLAYTQHRRGAPVNNCPITNT